MAIFKINFPLLSIGEIPQDLITSFSCVEDINKLYFGIKLNITDIAQQYYKALSTNIGTEAVVTLYRDSLEYVSNMRVLAVNNSYKAGSTITSTVDITLISSWYYNSTIATASYFGSVSEIIALLYKSEFESTGLKASINSSTDTPHKRYRISETPQAYMKRILKYGLSQSTPLYLYTDSNNTLNLKSLKDFFNSEVKYTFVADAAAEQGYITQAAMTESATQYMRLKDYKLQTLTQASSAATTAYFTVAAFASSQTPTNSLSLSNSEANNKDIYTTTPPTAKYYDWSYTPDDAEALATRDYLSTNLSTFTIQGKVDSLGLGSVTLGSLIRVALPNYDVSTAGGIVTKGYVIDHIERQYTGGGVVTTFSAFLARY